MLRQTDGPQGTVWKRAYEPYRAALKSTSIERGATTCASYTLTRDDLARVTTETQSGQMFTGKRSHPEPGVVVDVVGVGDNIYAAIGRSVGCVLPQTTGVIWPTWWEDGPTGSVETSRHHDRPACSRSFPDSAG